MNPGTSKPRRRRDQDPQPIKPALPVRGVTFFLGPHAVSDLTRRTFKNLHGFPGSRFSYDPRPRTNVEVLGHRDLVDSLGRGPFRGPDRPLPPCAGNGPKDLPHASNGPLPF